MNKLACVVALLAGCDALDGHEHRSLMELGAVTAEVFVDLGAPWGTGSDDVHPGAHVSLDYSASGCLSLEHDAEGMLDGTASDYSEVGYYDDGGGYGHNDDPYCARPAFYFERVPASRDVSTVEVSDASASFSVEIPLLLVNPVITLGELERGSIAVARVEDSRPITSVRVWFQSSYEEPTPVYWPVDATIVGTEVRFPVPTTARGSGTLGINLTYKEHDLACTGFASCDVHVQAGASFTRTFQ